MAEGLLRHDAGDRFEVESAGTNPSQVRPEALSVMKELGIDISGHRSKSVDEFVNVPFDYLLTVCDNAKESCPVFLSARKRIHHSFEDPASIQGTEKVRLDAFRKVSCGPISTVFHLLNLLDNASDWLTENFAGVFRSSSGSRGTFDG